MAQNTAQLSNTTPDRDATPDWKITRLYKRKILILTKNIDPNNLPINVDEYDGVISMRYEPKCIEKVIRAITLNREIAVVLSIDNNNKIKLKRYDSYL
jgi:hypothetical protein